MAFGGRGVNPAGSNDPIVHLTHLVEGHLLRYASGLAAASGASLPHRSNGRVSSQGAAGLVVPAAAAVAAETVAADTTGCPEGMFFQGRATAHRDRTRRLLFQRLLFGSLLAPRCRSADLPGRSRPIWHSSGGHRSRERDRDDEWTEHDTTRENTRRHRRVSRDDVTAARGDVHVNRGRDARNEEERKKREELERIMEENNRKIEEAQKKLAEERLAMVEEQRLMEEERQKMRKEHEKRVKEEQKRILGKNNSRPKLSFTLKSVT
ncbi:hypothetical protein ALC56_03428 [Trachymyrmex septentrionalis]|uniref:Uncharacterized protein n=1 Tax=Trachymyrmex septentrionalis TaxID=34720 RepID=A0A195FP01_9HYME|nr:hypothetical protein ALC56_03428 [Trachymyrmex septentrionalis]